MRIPEAKQYLGQTCEVVWNDRNGQEQKKQMLVHDVTFVPLYGGYLIGDTEDICLERVMNISATN